jgi:predicted dehydrogenase
VVTVFELAMNAVSRACFEFPWVVLMEKPPGYNLADAEAIHAAALAKQRRVWVGLNRRFLSSTRAVREGLEGDPIQPRFIHVQDQQSLATAAAIGHPEAVVTHWMYANSIHLVDYLPVFGRGRVASVDVVEPWNPLRPGLVLAKVRFDSGDLGLYEGIWQGPGPWAVTVTTPSKRWELRPLEQAAAQAAGTRKLEPLPVHAWDQAFKPGFRLQAEHVVAAVRGQPSDAVALSEALETMRLIQRIFGQ